MQQKPHIALLPGLDGTGELFYPILPFLEDAFTVHVVHYSDEVSLSDYVDSAREQIPDDEPISLVGESFSGPIAISLLADGDIQCNASVLCATFCRSPLPKLTNVTRLFPEFLFSTNPLTYMCQDLFVLGAGAGTELRQATRRTLSKVNPVTYRNRVKLINDVDVSQQLACIDTPLLYLQATRDLVVYEDSFDEISNLAKDIVCKRIEGSHMILQTQPEICAKFIFSHIKCNETRNWN